MSKVYVSSTFKDLREYRLKVREALVQLGHQPMAMETDAADGKRPIKTCLEDVANSDIYIGIFAWRYGWTPKELNPQQLSITHLEYNEAVAKKRLCLIFVLDDDFDWPPSRIDDDRTQIRNLRDTASERHRGIPFTNGDNLASHVKAALYKLAVNPRTSDGDDAESAALDKARYFSELAKRYHRLDLEGLTPPEKEEYLQVTLRSVFVEPLVRDEPPPVDLPRELRARFTDDDEVGPDDFPEELPLEEVRRTSDVYYLKPPQPILDVLTNPQHGRVVILGDPGSGKSTLTRYIILSLIDAAGDRKLHQAFPAYLPILIELKSYIALRTRHHEWHGFLDFLAHLERTEGFYPENEALERYLSADGRALVIFDGLDEVFNRDERAEIARQIVYFGEKYPRVRVIVTSRIIGYGRRPFDDGSFRHFTLQELSVPQVTEFIEKWYGIALSDRPVEAQKLRQRLLQAFETSRSVRQLSSNPMLLTIMAIIGKHQDLPRDRWKLYDHAATVLIQHWDVARYVNAHARVSDAGAHTWADLPADSAIDAEDKREMLRRLALRLQGGKSGLFGNYVHRRELQQEFEGYLRERYDLAPLQAKSVAQLMLMQFRERNFILSLYGANLYGFVHRAFLEYFCATAFLAQFERTRALSFDALLNDVFGANWHDQSWHEVLRLICGMLHHDFAPRVIEFLGDDARRPKVPTTVELSKPWNLALAVQCLGEIRNLRLAAAPAEALLRNVCALFDADMHRPPKLFSFIKRQIVPPAVAIGSSWPRNDVLAEILRERGSYRFAYIYDHTFGTFVGSVGGGSTAVHAAVLHSAEHPQHQQRVLTPFALACGWHDHADTLPRLHAMSDDPDQTVRYAALYALSEHFAKEPGTLEMLRLHALEGQFTFERAAALNGLAKQYADDRSVFELLHHRARLEADKFPRTSAIKGIGEYFRGQPETLRLMLDIAEHDASPEIGDEQFADAYYGREAAIDTLARYWPQQAETLACLKRVSTEDRVRWMREKAAALLTRLQQPPAT